MGQEWEHRSLEQHTSTREILQNSEEKFRNVFTFPGMYKKRGLESRGAESHKKGKSAGEDEKGDACKTEGWQGN